MMGFVSIAMKEETREKLKELKLVPQESYEHVIIRKLGLEDSEEKTKETPE